MDLYTKQPITTTDGERMREHLDRVQREEREWFEARLHAALHGNWLSRDECSTCQWEAEGKDVVMLSADAVKKITDAFG